ncbi:MAG: ribosome biogenesis GTP-binding protein YihA/YsxC [Pseudomonadota bacterium]
MIKDIPNNWFTRFEFLLGVASINQFPADEGSELAFAGRSNVGKSSVINKLTQRKSLARTSKSPGRTREINYFQFEPGINLVDLPGYGFAKVNAEMKARWAELLEYYLAERQSLRGVFLIMDIRHPLGKFDQDMLNYCRANDLRVHILLNKCDKLSRNARNQTLLDLGKQLYKTHESCQLFSALKSDGVDEARKKMVDWLFE